MNIHKHLEASAREPATAFNLHIGTGNIHYPSLTFFVCICFLLIGTITSLLIGTFTLLLMVTPKLHFILPDFDRSLFPGFWGGLAREHFTHPTLGRRREQVGPLGPGNNLLPHCRLQCPFPHWTSVIDFKAKQITEYTYWTGGTSTLPYNRMFHSTNLNSDRKIQEEAASPCGIGTLGLLEDIANQPLWNKSKLDKYTPLHGSKVLVHNTTGTG